jgi:hypothetical protein
MVGQKKQRMEDQLMYIFIPNTFIGATPSKDFWVCYFILRVLYMIKNLHPYVHSGDFTEDNFMPFFFKKV